MPRTTTTVAERRNYKVRTVHEAKKIASDWLKLSSHSSAVGFGLPEVDDRYHIWRIPLIKQANKERLGEVVIDAHTSLIDIKKSTQRDLIQNRLLKNERISNKKASAENDYIVSPLRNTIALGDCKEVLAEMPASSIDLIFNGSIKLALPKIVLPDFSNSSSIFSSVFPLMPP